MDEVTMDLIGVTPLNIANGVPNHLWPVVAKSSKSISKFGSEWLAPHIES